MATTAHRFKTLLSPWKEYIIKMSTKLKRTVKYLMRKEITINQECGKEQNE